MKKKKVKKTKKKSSNLERAYSREKEQGESSSFSKVISTIIALFLAIFIALSNFSLCGSIGSIVRNIILSTFGTLGYFFPLVIVISVLINLFNTKVKANIKIYSLIILYVTFICFLECLIHDFSIESDYFIAIEGSIKRALDQLSFDPKFFSGGLLGTGVSYILVKALGKVGSMVLFGAISLISFILLFGLGISKIIIKILRAIVMFIPNLIRKGQERKAEDKQIAIDNENLLKETIEKNKQVNLNVALDTKYGNEKLTFEPLPEKEKKSFDTSKINITADDIQSRFYKVDEEEVAEKNNLLREMRKKSINEILFEKPEIKPDAFFYTENMKPIDQMENITVPEPRVSVLSKNALEPKIVFPESRINIMEQNNTIMEEDEDSIYNNNDNKKFASGLDDLRKEGDTIDYKNESSEEVLKDIEKGTRDIEIKNKALRSDDMVTRAASQQRRVKKYKFPLLNFLEKGDKTATKKDPNLNEKANVLVETLKQFGVGVTVTNITVGPSVTRFELKPDLGVKVAKILSLESDVKLALAASEIRIEAPIPGKSAIGIEIPNEESSGVMLGDIISSSEFRNSTSKLTVAIGKDISGKVIVTDLRKMPHLLIAGATGSGKSVCINSLITSLIYKASPSDVRLIMVDPKVVELQVYDGIPHLLIPVVTNPKKAAGALNWAVNEMTRRYNLIQEKRVRDIESYNQAIEGEISKIKVSDDNVAELETKEKLPYIVIIIDEFADLMMVASKEVENAIMRIAQLARACGIYLVIATQRPSVNVISGSIKTNVPSRISFAVSSGVDSQTILDRRGAEKLLGHGDMLYFPQGIPEPIRVQGCYVSESEILKVVDYVKDTGVIYDEEAEKAIDKGLTSESGSGYDSNERDDMFYEAGKLIIEQQSASIGMLQRRFRMGFNRAARVIDQLADEGVISKQDGKKPREVLMEIDEFIEKYGG